MAEFVLVHGAWHGGWCWRDVKAILEDAGHVVHAPTLSGLADRAHLLSVDITLDTFISDIASYLHFNDLSDVVLCGHSFGGPVISGVAEREPSRIRAMVFLDAAIVEDGESVLSVMDEKVQLEREALARETSGGVSMPVPSAAAMGIFDEEQITLLTRNLTPHPWSSFKSPISLSKRPGEGFSCTYIVCTSPVYEPLAYARDRARRYGWQIVDVEAGHDLMLSAPRQTAERLMEVAERSSSR